MCVSGSNTLNTGGSTYLKPFNMIFRTSNNDGDDEIIEAALTDEPQLGAPFESNPFRSRFFLKKFAHKPAAFQHLSGSDVKTLFTLSSTGNSAAFGTKSKATTTLVI